MTQILNYEFKIILPKKAVSFFENALEETASAVLTVMIEHGLNKGKWELQAIFEGKPDESYLDSVLKEAALKAGIEKPDISVVPMPNKNWLKECYQSFKPLTIGRYYIYGSHLTDPLPVDKITLKIDAATAFGTGEHQTTKGCLMALDELTISPLRVLDVGCGSGILSMACAKGSGRKVDSVDIDPESVRVSIQNARENGLSDLLNVFQSNGYESVVGRYDLILCNILARPLIEMAGDLANHLNKGGIAILSGFLTRQERFVLKAHEEVGLQFLKKYRIDGWSTLVMKKED